MVEAEFIALSCCLREFLPMRETAEEICRNFNVNMGDYNQLRSTVFEDNSGCLSIGKAKRMNPRTKHIAAPYHWFFEQIGPDSGIELVKIDTTEQKADIFTKGLEKATFLMVRKLLIGW